MNFQLLVGAFILRLLIVGVLYKLQKEGSLYWAMAPVVAAVAFFQVLFWNKVVDGNSLSMVIGFFFIDLLAGYNYWNDFFQKKKVKKK